MINKLSIAIVGILLMTGMNNNSRLQASEIEENILTDSIEAIQKILKFGIDISNFDRETLDTDTDTDTKLISFKDLIEYLPDTPRGWTARKPKGETNSFGDYGISQVSQTFEHEDDDKQIKVSIFDGAFNSVLSTPFQLATEFSRESTEGYNKAVTIDDIPGREIYNYSNKQGSLHLLVDSRFLVQIEGSNIEDTDLREWWRSLELQSLTAIDN